MEFMNIIEEISLFRMKIFANLIHTNLNIFSLTSIFTSLSNNLLLGLRWSVT